VRSGRTSLEPAPDASRFVVSRAGSAALGLQTSTSDLDIVVACDSGIEGYMQQLVAPLRATDIELLAWDRFATLVAQVRAHRPNVRCDFPSVNYLDLRFLSDCCLADPIAISQPALATYGSLQAGVGPVITSWANAEWVNAYQDSVGLYLDNRFDEFALAACSLVQLSCRAANSLLQSTSIRAKWAPALSIADTRLRSRARRLIDMATQGDARTAAGALRLLRAANGLVARAKVLSEGDTQLDVERHIDQEIRHCVIAVRRVLALFDVQTRTISLCNHATLRQLASY
jgi:hypothetical protein